MVPRDDHGVGGITLVDVTDPHNPKKLVEGAGDFTLKARGAANGVPQTKANQTHSAFAWEQRDASGNKTGKVFVVLVDDLELDDIDILDITNPSRPTKVKDFNPYRVQATFQGGPANGKVFTAIQGSATKPVNKDNPVSGDTRFLGLGCDPVAAVDPADQLIAVVERGVCDFQVKLNNIEAAGYKALIVFNRTGVDGCETLVTMLAQSETTPAVFVSRKDGFRLLGVEPDDLANPAYSCSTDGTGTPTPAGPSVPVDISAVFDGWGYTHMYRTDLTEGAKMQEVDFYAPDEGQNEAFAENFGDMTVHEVATDPDENLVYVSHYALGMRVLRYDDSGLTEVGKFVEEGGSNYWGVEVHKFGGQKYILGSDRDRGLRVFKFNG